jgi:hypothetical protein
MDEPESVTRQLHLSVGDVLIFEERVGPKTGDQADADPAHRHAVRLTRVTPHEDPVVKDSQDRNQPIVEIEWDVADALPFPLCLSIVGGSKCELLSGSVARGNVVLVDHGSTVADEELGSVTGTLSPTFCIGEGHRSDPVIEVRRFAPNLQRKPLTFSVPVPADSWIRVRVGRTSPESPPVALTAASLLVPSAPDPREASPQIKVWSIPPRPGGTEIAPLFERDDLERPAILGERLRPERLRKAPDEATSTLDTVNKRRQNATPSASVLEGLPHDLGRRLDEWATGSYLRGQLSPGTLHAVDKLGASDSLTPSLSEDLRRDLGRLLEAWIPRGDHLSSGPTDRHFVVETDDESSSHLRFGDGELGRRPEAGAAFFATYRIGSGPAGNVGAEAISRIVFRRAKPSGARLRARNPLAAAGGTAPEAVANVKLLAPHRFRTELARAITADDYARLAERHPAVQRAGAELRWTGSRELVAVAIDQAGRAEATPGLLSEIATSLRQYRRIGHDLVVLPARQVALDVALEVRVLTHYLQGHVKAALLDAFSNRTLPGGGRGFFHPDNLTFGEGVHLSKLVATAQAVAGVEGVRVTKLQRLFEQARDELERGLLPIGPLEVARLDNDPSCPEHGRLTVHLRGGL